jgi:cathepsin X
MKFFIILLLSIFIITCITNLYLINNKNTHEPKSVILQNIISNTKFPEYVRSPEAQNAIKIGTVPTLPNTLNVQDQNALRLINLNNIPNNFDWRNVTKHNFYPSLQPGNYCVPVRNQHIPQYCGSCFAFGSVQTLGDRFNIMKALQNKGNNQFSKIELSIQHVLNCLPNMTCFTGGDSYLVYQLILSKGGIPDETCKSYEANVNSNKCEPPCYTCLAKGQNNCADIGEKTFTKFGNNRCCKVEKFDLYGIEGFSNINARFKNEIKNKTNKWSQKDLIKYIQTEIYLNGPVTIAIDAIPLETFSGGRIFSTPKNYTPELNHLVAIVGWGTDTQTNKIYWVIRNSWGSFWAENGYIRIFTDSAGLSVDGNDVFGAYPKGWLNTSGQQPGDENIN